MKKSQILKIVRDEFAKKYNCKTHTKSNFSVMNTLVYPRISSDFLYDLGYFIQVRRSFWHKEIVAGVVFENNSYTGRQTVYFGLADDKDKSIIENIKKSCDGSLDIVVRAT